MKSTILFGVLAFTAVASSALAQKSSIALPSDPSAMVIMMDWRGGLEPPTPPGACPDNGDKPMFTIRANGRMTLIPRFGCRFVIETMLPADRVQDLLRFAIDQGFHDFSGDAVKRAVAAEARRSGDGPAVSDDVTTVIRVKTAEKDHEVSLYALRYYAGKYPTVKELAGFAALETRLRGLVDQLQNGLRQSISVALDQANRAAAQERPNLSTLGFADHRRTSVVDGGRLITEFERGLGDKTSVNVSVESGPGTEPKTTFRVVRNP